MELAHLPRRARGLPALPFEDAEYVDEADRKACLSLMEASGSDDVLARNDLHFVSVSSVFVGRRA